MRTLNNNNVQEEVEYLNKLLRGKKRGLKRIAEEDYQRTKEQLLNELDKLGYKIDGNRIVVQDVLQEGIQSVGQEVIQIVGPVEGEELQKFNEDIEILTKNKKEFIKLMSNFDVLMEIVTKYKDNKTVPSENIELHLPEEDDKSYKTSLRVNKVVWEQFKEFCERHKSFSQKDLVSMALICYMKKYD